MKTVLYAILFVVFAAAGSLAQVAPFYQQNFDGTSHAYATLNFRFDSSASNVWQVGRPSKTIFWSAATVPRALMTDTAAAYPPNRTSSVGFSLPKLSPVFQSILAVRWKQKLDLDSGLDGGIVEYSIDTGATWVNVFNNPYVYNFYGYMPVNQDTLPDSQICFSGRDTVWRDIWLCFDGNWARYLDSIMFRFTLKSDSVHSGREGWMMDNFFIQRTYIHTVKAAPSAQYLHVYPTETTGVVNIEAEKQPGYHLIENMELTSASGRFVQAWRKCPTKFFINIANQPPGLYYLKVQTNVSTETVPIVLKQ